MKRFYLILLLLFQNCILLFSQEKYNFFINEFSRFYENKKTQFQIFSEKAIKQYYLKNESDFMTEDFKILSIPEILLKKSKKIYQNIDSTNLVQYFDAKSMFYNLTLVYRDSTYLGTVLSKNNTNNEYLPKPQVEEFVYENLFLKLSEIQPDIIFTVQNINGYFLIKEKKIFVLHSSNLCSTYKIYSMDEYTEKFKSDIFTIFFHYEPRIKNIICGNVLYLVIM